VYAGGIIQSSGVWISANMGGTLMLENVQCQGSGAVAPVIQLEPISAMSVTLAGIMQAATPQAGIVIRSGYAITATVTGYTQIDGSDNLVATFPFLTLGGTAASGQISAGTLGSGFAAKEGSNAKQGVATLAAGTVTVANTSVTANSRIFLTAQDNSSVGVLRVSARTAGTSFTITSSNAGDTGVVAYEIFEPA
jgi:hypothetical protein